MNKEKLQEELGNKIKVYEKLTFEFCPNWDNIDEVIVTIAGEGSKKMMMLRDDEIVLAMKLLELCKHRFDKKF